MGIGRSSQQALVAPVLPNCQALKGSRCSNAGLEKVGERAKHAWLQALTWCVGLPHLP